VQSITMKDKKLWPKGPLPRAARRSVPPPKPKCPVLTVGQKQRRIARLQKCMQRLDAFDPQKVQRRVGVPEHQDASRRNSYLRTGLWIAAHALTLLAYDKRSERRQHHGLAAFKAIGDSFRTNSTTCFMNARISSSRMRHTRGQGISPTGVTTFTSE
jgi:hypothetical protein